MNDSNNGMVWKNPCPDASVPSCPSSAYGTFNVNGGNGGAFTPNDFGNVSLISGPSVWELSGAQRPSAYTIQTTHPVQDAVPNFDEMFDIIRKRCNQMTEEILDLKAQLEIYKNLHYDYEVKLARIKNCL